MTPETLIRYADGLAISARNLADHIADELTASSTRRRTAEERRDMAASLRSFAASVADLAKEVQEACASTS